MPERKCDYPILARDSGGQATCPEKNFKMFREKGKCDSCTKVRMMRSKIPMSEREEKAAQIVREIKSDAWRRARGLG